MDSVFLAWLFALFRVPPIVFVVVVAMKFAIHRLDFRVLP